MDPLQINLSCTSITDVGLLSLASISCLQSMIILHLKGLSPRGLAAALLACGGLTKVKLHSSFKSLLPQPLFEHLEARGCVFQWREKMFQVKLIIHQLRDLILNLKILRLFTSISAFIMVNILVVGIIIWQLFDDRIFLNF